MNNPNCPGCGKPLHKVTQSANSMLNAEQFDAARAGDWFCPTCPGNNQARTGYRYFWEKDLAAWGRDMIAPQAASQQALPAVVMECVKAVSIGYTDTNHMTEELHCADCKANLDGGDDHKPDCLTLRARAFLAPQAATTASASDAEQPCEGPHDYQVSNARTGEQSCTLCGKEWEGFAPPTKASASGESLVCVKCRSPKRDDRAYCMECGENKFDRPVQITKPERFAPAPSREAALLGSAQLCALVDMYRKGAVLEDVFQRAAALARAPLPAPDHVQEPVYQAWIGGHWRDVPRSTFDLSKESDRRTLYATPEQAADVARDAARLDYIEKKAVRGGTYQTVTSIDVIVYTDDLKKGVRHAIDRMIERTTISRTNTTGGSDE